MLIQLCLSYKICWAVSAFLMVACTVRKYELLKGIQVLTKRASVDIQIAQSLRLSGSEKQVQV